MGEAVKDYFQTTREPLPNGLRYSHIEGRRGAPPPSVRSRSERRGGPTRAKPERGGGRSRRFVDDQARVSMAALAQPPHHPRHPRASPSHPPPLPLPATRLRRAGGGRSEKPTCVNPVARSGEGFVPLKHRG